MATAAVEVLVAPAAVQSKAQDGFEETSARGISTAGERGGEDEDEATEDAAVAAIASNVIGGWSLLGVSWLGDRFGDVFLVAAGDVRASHGVC